MRLTLVHDWLTGMRGGEKCLEVVCRRFPDAPLYTLLHRAGSTCPAIERMPIRTSALQRLPGVARYYRYLLPAMPRVIDGLRLPIGTDVVLSFSHAVAGRAAPPPGVPHVCYCFTPMRYAWHMRAAYFGQATSRWARPRPLSALRNYLLDGIRDWDRQASQRVSHFVAISQTVADRIGECYGRDSTIIYPPVDTHFYEPAAVKRDDYYLVVSALAPYKRIDLAIEACRQRNRRLVVIGTGPEYRKLKSLAQGAKVTFLGWQSNEVIRHHLQRCRALLFPGCEDFGIVPLEAQACGTPVLALQAGGATETVLAATEKQPGAGRFFAEATSSSLADAMGWLEQHTEQFCPARARRQAERFATARYERELLNFLAGVAGSPVKPDVGQAGLAPRRAG